MPGPSNKYARYTTKLLLLHCKRIEFLFLLEFPDEDKTTGLLKWHVVIILALWWIQRPGDQNGSCLIVFISSVSSVSYEETVNVH